MLHAGVLKKFGLYGLMRIALPLMPEAARSWMHVIAFLCLGNIFYVGLVAIRQRQFNLLIGNSSVAHMGLIFLGIASLDRRGRDGRGRDHGRAWLAGGADVRASTATFISRRKRKTWTRWAG